MKLKIVDADLIVKNKALIGLSSHVFLGESADEI